MDTSEYLPMFLAESREHLQELNLAVVRIEESPDDRETVDEIFRIAHSMKGMSATMGFAQMASLTHEMEDVFELLRQRAGGLSREAVDVLLECLDALSAAVDAIDTEGVEKLDAEPLKERLKGLVRERTPEQQVERRGGVTDLEELRKRAGGRRVVHVHVELDEETQMPAVRAFMVLGAVAKHGEVIGSHPTEEGVDLFDGRVVELWVATDVDESEVSSAAIDVPDVESSSAEVVDFDDVAEEIEQIVEAVHEEAGGQAVGEAAAPRDAGGGKRTSSTVRVDADRLDQLMHLMGELVVQRTRLESLIHGANVPGLPQAIKDLTRSSQALQAQVMQVRMIPVDAVFMRFPRLVRDLSTKLDKHVELVLSGKETELDRTVVDTLGDPIVHLVRNSLDHGLETPAERKAAGKPEAGTLEISARHAGGNVVISVRDDGRGIDPAHVARKAAERGMIPAEAVDSVDMTRAIELLFAAGFSTAEETSDISGRGVGMDAVRTTIRELGGEVVMTSAHGVGTTAEIRLPLTLAIMAALLVDAVGLPFAIPLDRVERTLDLRDQTVRSVAGSPMLVLREAALPLIDLGAALGYESCGNATHAVIVRSRKHRLALAVDVLVGQRELVTRPLPPELGDRAALSGGAVLSNGDIALIVDCDAIAEVAAVDAPRLAYAA